MGSLGVACCHLALCSQLDKGWKMDWEGGKVKVTRSYDITIQPASAHYGHKPKSLLPLTPIQQYSSCLPPSNRPLFPLLSVSLPSSPFLFPFLHRSLYFFFLPLSLSLSSSLSGWTGTEPTNTAIKRTPVWVWKLYQGLTTLTLPLHTLT